MNFHIFSIAAHRPPVRLLSVIALLCGRPIGRPSVCLPVCPVRAFKKRRRTKTGVGVPQGTSKMPIFSLKRSKVKVTGRKKPYKAGIMFTYERPIKRRRIRHQLQTRSTPLLGLIYCRRLNMRCSANGWTAACRVGIYFYV